MNYYKYSVSARVSYGIEQMKLRIDSERGFIQESAEYGYVECWNIIDRIKDRILADYSKQGVFSITMTLYILHEKDLRVIGKETKTIYPIWAEG